MFHRSIDSISLLLEGSDQVEHMVLDEEGVMGELPNLMERKIKVSPAQIAEFCQRWHIIEFALFGPVLRDDFRPDSDIDVLLTFDSRHPMRWDDRIKMHGKIEQLFRHKIDLVNKKYLKNPYRRYEILSTCEVVYAAE